MIGTKESKIDEKVDLKMTKTSSIILQVRIDFLYHPPHLRLLKKRSNRKVLSRFNLHW